MSGYPAAIDAVPYPWPYDACLIPERTALVLVALQENWAAVDPAGVVRARCAALLEHAQRAGLWVCLVHPRLPEARRRRRRVAGAPVTSWGTPLPGFEPERQILVAQPPGLDGFFGTALDAALWTRGISHLLVAGFGTETAIHSTLRSANDRGFECLTVSDACAALEPALQEAALNTIMMSGGIFGAHAPLAAVLMTLARMAADPATGSGAGYLNHGSTR